MNILICTNAPFGKPTGLGGVQKGYGKVCPHYNEGFPQRK
jgi:hypothetical protein